MQTAFEQTKETAIILTVAGNVENKTIANYGDDGTSQKATISKGIAGKEDVIVPNPVILRPYRTFLEVEQPESKFIFRIKEGRDGTPMFKHRGRRRSLEIQAVASIKLSERTY